MIWKTITDITMNLTASELHGIGAGISLHGTHGASRLGDTEAGTTHGTTEAGTEVIGAGTIRGITEAGMEAIGAGMTLGIILTTLITDGMILTGDTSTVQDTGRAAPDSTSTRIYGRDRATRQVRTGYLQAAPRSEEA